MCCKGCQKRTIGCHAICEDYKKEREENDKKIEWNRKQSVGKAYVFSRGARVMRMLKNKRGRL
jgi:hypothetical protein